MCDDARQWVVKHKDKRRLEEGDGRVELKVMHHQDVFNTDNIPCYLDSKRGMESTVEMKMMTRFAVISATQQSCRRRREEDVQIEKDWK
jgi:hypothetical protein